MGKGDARTTRGKINKSSYGNTRPSKDKPATKATAKPKAKPGK